MHIAILSPYATVIPHFEAELDIAQQHLDAGDTVEFMNCTGGLTNCDFNVDRQQTRCDECVARRQMGLSLLSPSPNCHSFSDDGSESKTYNLANQAQSLKTKFESVEELINYKIDNFDIGYAVLSSVVSTCRDPEPDLAKHDALLVRFLKTAWQSYFQTLEFINQKSAKGQPLDRVYVYNGRFAGMRGVFRACQKLGVDCYLHERGCDPKHYELMKNHLPHDISMIEKAIKDGWQAAASNPDREKIAAGWFHDRVNRVEKAWHSFVKDQEAGRLPDDFDASRKNVSIFCSSDDEFVAIGKEWHNDMYPNQVHAAKAISRDLFAAQPETHIYLRVHPNLKGVDNQRLRDALALDLPNLTVIAPDAPVDTYELVKSSDTVVSFGSSVGSEAIFWGKPSVLLGPCFYENLGGVYRSRSHEETIKLLCRDLEPQEKTAALMYGFWFQTRGFPHKHFEATGLFEGTFKGQIVHGATTTARPPLRGLKKLRRRASQAFASLLGN